MVPATLILLQTAPIGFANSGWKYYLVIILWSAFFIPSKFDFPGLSSSLLTGTVIYFFFPETARLTLEEIAKNFGEEVAVNLTEATDEERARIDQNLVQSERTGSATADEAGSSSTEQAKHG